MISWLLVHAATGQSIVFYLVFCVCTVVTDKEVARVDKGGLLATPLLRIFPQLFNAVLLSDVSENIWHKNFISIPDSIVCFNIDWNIIILIQILFYFQVNSRGKHNLFLQQNKWYDSGDWTNNSRHLIKKYLCLLREVQVTFLIANLRYVFSIKLGLCYIINSPIVPSNNNYLLIIMNSRLLM